MAKSKKMQKKINFFDEKFAYIKNLMYLCSVF